jgi:hypothetical protein
MALSELPTEINLMLQIQTPLLLHTTNGQMYNLLKGYLYLRDGRSLAWAVENGLEATASNNTVQCAVDAGRYLNLMPGNFHIALQGAADRGYAHLVERLLKVNGINPNFGGHKNRLLFSLPVKMAIVLWLNCSLPWLILIRMLEVEKMLIRRCSMPAIRDMYLL